ncbi:MAG: hypothetical protein HIU92_21175 [Proteobacteria bacterium]|nr:hypothetical protein [Pseudomonadota bacterium]
MNGRPRKGHRVAFGRDDGVSIPVDPDPITGLRFTIAVQNGGEALIDFTALRPRRLALAAARALRHLAAPGGPLGARMTVMAYAATLPKFFACLSESHEPVEGISTLRGRHIDQFETWLEARGLTRIHLYTLLVKVVGVLRQIGIDSPDEMSPDLRDRLRYVSAKPFQRSRPRDAYSPYVARQLRDAARDDIAAVIRRLQEEPPPDPDPVLRRMQAAVDAIIKEHGLIRQSEPAFLRLYHARRRRGRPNRHLADELHGRRYLTTVDVVPFLVVLALETGLEIECCKTLTVDCLQNASGGTVEIAYLKRRARGAEHKRLRVRDGGSTAPGGLIRRLLEITAAARRHHPSENLWVYCGAGTFGAGIRHPQVLVDAWTRRHGIVDDDGRPLRLLLSRLRKTHKALWYLKTEGHVARFAVGHTPEVAARHYADVPALRPLHEATVAAAFREAVASAITPTVLTPEQEAAWRAEPADSPNLPAGYDPAVLLGGEQDVWLASCAGFYASPHSPAGAPCPLPFWGCLECPNAVITARKLPAILAFLDFIEDQRRALHAGDWAAKFGRAHARITSDVLPTFAAAVVSEARRLLVAEPATIYLPPEARL